MKLTVIGGAGVRAPLLIGSLAKRANTIGLDEVTIFDIDKRKLDLMMPLSRAVLDIAGNQFKLNVAETPEEAVQNADAVITTIREGFEEGRATDERICANNNVLGQETTGAAGFAFAIRSIPALLNYAELLFKANPNAWLINFTNPAGLVTQAMHNSGFDRVIGVCDSAETAKIYAADFLSIDEENIETDVCGLNHLSFTTSIKAKGKQALKELLSSTDFCKQALPVFPLSVIKKLGCYLNEYLYYFLLREEALKGMLAEEKTRGELIVGWNADLLTNVEKLLDKNDIREALDYYYGYQRKRNESYMEYARTEDRYLPTDEEAGYAAVALDFLLAINGDKPTKHAFCVPNKGAISALDDKEVVEVTCEIGNGKINPVQGIKLPEEAVKLITDVKRYETIGVESILESSIDKAIEALNVHPLIQNAATAAKLFEDFKASQPKYFENWK